jgi:hypothetical protein
MGSLSELGERADGEAAQNGIVGGRVVLEDTGVLSAAQLTDDEDGPVATGDNDAPSTRHAIQRR